MINSINSEKVLIVFVSMVVVFSSVYLISVPGLKADNDSPVLGAADVVTYDLESIETPSGWVNKGIMDAHLSTDYECVDTTDCELMILSNGDLDVVLSTPTAVRAQWTASNPDHVEPWNLGGDIINTTIENFLAPDNSLSIPSFQVYGCSNAGICFQAGPLAINAEEREQQIETLQYLIKDVVKVTVNL